MPPSLDISRVSQRWLVCGLCCWAFALPGYSYLCYLRLEDIIKSTSESTKYNLTNECPSRYSTKSCEKEPSQIVPPDVFGTPKVTNFVYMAFYLGRLIMLIPAGVASDLGFSKYVLGAGVLFLAVSFLSPITSDSKEVFVLGQMLVGVSEAFIITSLYSLVSRWAPPSKLYLFNTLIHAGYNLGQIIGDVILFKYTFLRNNSWSEGNVVSGAIVLLWLPFGFIFIHHSPSESPFIIPQELRTTTNRGRRLSRLLLTIRLRKIPWCKILLSSPFLSLNLAYCSMTEMVHRNLDVVLTKYQHYVLLIPRQSKANELLISNVYTIPSTLMGALFVDWVVNHKLLSRTEVAKVLVFISMFTSLVLQVILLLIWCPSATLFWIIYIIPYYTIGFALPNILIGPVVLYPWNAGLLSALVVGGKSLIEILDMFVYYHLITKLFNSTLNQLRFEIIYYSILTLVLTVPYLVFGSEEVQNWRRRTSVSQLSNLRREGRPVSTELWD